MAMPTAVWSKSYPCKPKSNLQSHVLINEKPFKASYEKDPIAPPSMTLILSNEYARIWQKEHCDFVIKSKNSAKKKTIGPKAVHRTNKWIELHNTLG